MERPPRDLLTSKMPGQDGNGPRRVLANDGEREDGVYCVWACKRQEAQEESYRHCKPYAANGSIHSTVNVIKPTRQRKSSVARKGKYLPRPSCDLVNVSEPWITREIGSCGAQGWIPWQTCIESKLNQLIFFVWQRTVGL